MILSIITMLIALFFIAYAYFAITNAKYLASMVGEGRQSEADLAQNIVYVGYVFLVWATILLFGSIGLMFKLNFCRYIVIVICCYLLIFGFPLAIAFFLCEKDIKELFGKETEKPTSSIQSLI